MRARNELLLLLNRRIGARETAPSNTGNKVTLSFTSAGSIVGRCANYMYGGREQEN